MSLNYSLTKSKILKEESNLEYAIDNFNDTIFSPIDLDSHQLII